MVHVTDMVSGKTDKCLTNIFDDMKKAEKLTILVTENGLCACVAFFGFHIFF